MNLLEDWLWQTFKKAAAFIHLTLLKNTVATCVTDGANPKHCKDIKVDWTSVAADRHPVQRQNS